MHFSSSDVFSISSCLFEYIRSIKQNLGLQMRNNQLLDYDKIANEEWSDDMYLNQMYENFFNIEKELIDIANKIANN